MKIIKNVKCAILMYTLLIIFMFCFYFNKNINGLFFISVLFFVLNLVYCASKIYVRFPLFLLNICHFIFFQGGLLVRLINNENLSNPYDENIIIQVILQICMVYIFYILVPFCFERYAKKMKFKGNRKNDNSKIQNGSKILFYITYVFSLALAIEKIYYVFTNDYITLYSQFTSVFPYWFVKISQINFLAFVLYLVTLPSYKKSRIIIVLYLFNSLLTSLAGSRMYIILAIFNVATYIVIYGYYFKEKVFFFKSKFIITMCLIMPIALTSLSVFSYIRNDSEYGKISIKYGVEEFLRSQGGAYEILANSVIYKEELSDHKYLFQPIKAYMCNNYISKNILNIEYESYESPSYEAGTKSGALADRLSYILLGKERYLNGEGVGSSYVAEAYIDYSYIGILFMVVIYTFIFYSLYVAIYRGNWMVSFLCFGSLQYIYISPRSVAFNFFQMNFTFFNLLILFIIYGINRYGIFDNFIVYLSSKIELFESKICNVKRGDSV